MSYAPPILPTTRPRPSRSEPAQAHNATASHRTQPKPLGPPLCLLSFRAILGTVRLRNTSISLLRSFLAPSTYDNYNNALRFYFSFCGAKGLPPLLNSTSTTIVRNTAWLGLLGTVAASSICNLTFGGQQVLPRPPATPHHRG
jgi:hypothetical protein